MTGRTYQHVTCRLGCMIERDASGESVMRDLTEKERKHFDRLLAGSFIEIANSLVEEHP